MLDGSGLIHVVTTCSMIVLSVLLQHQSVQVLVSDRQWAILEHRLMNQKRDLKILGLIVPDSIDSQHSGSWNVKIVGYLSHEIDPLVVATIRIIW